MRAGALAPYERALESSATLGLQTDDGRTIRLDVARWLAPAGPGDETVLRRCSGPVLDVGCGPGRLVSSLNARGVAALGVDIAPTAVALTRARGLLVLLRDVFDAVPGEGRWPTVLLIDGNIGIGGDPVRLLARIRTLLASQGTLIIECDPDPLADHTLDVRFAERGEPVGPWFRWSAVGRDALLHYATAAGYSPGECWSSGERSFVALVR